MAKEKFSIPFDRVTDDCGNYVPKPIVKNLILARLREDLAFNDDDKYVLSVGAYITDDLKKEYFDAILVELTQQEVVFELEDCQRFNLEFCVRRDEHMSGGIYEIKYDAWFALKNKPISDDIEGDDD